jgi:hypothetical protein
MTNPKPQTPNPLITYLRSPGAIRKQCGLLFELACHDQLRYFRPDRSQLERVAEYVLQVTRENYPDLRIPFHSRWRHFEVGGLERLQRLEQGLAALAPIARIAAKFDLAIVSVLLDAGAGALWQYAEPATGQVFRRSEGLAIASFQLFCDGGFASNGKDLRVDAIALQHLTESTLARGFQVTPDNPLVGLQGRVDLLQRLGQLLPQYPHLFGAEHSRPGNLAYYLVEQAAGGQLPASTVLSAVLEGFSEIWRDRPTLAGVPLGDVWHHPAAPPHPTTLIPFHKLSQWLTYSLLEPLQELGLEIVDLDALTGLPEYRNGGLCLDLGLLQVKQPAILQQTHLPGSEAIVEWRALTIILLDQIAAALRQKLGMTATELPLVKVLQGGTWAAGRKIAAERRPGGIPPIQIESDGTVF